ncbi:MAG TPA: GvpL/GvpF family gas vesicle protein [Gemmatimonadaceae bacterium]|nr:GvpL/GvpF family gas vesicle protein [Gemmatimonadaceae bacterium]
MRRTRGDKEIGVALNLFGVTFVEASTRGTPVLGTELIVVRDLAAIVAPGAYAVVEPTEEAATVMAGAVSAYAKRAAVLPAPVGVVFRSREAVTRWLELHYVALSDALSFVDDRVVGRVHVWRPGEASEREVGSDLAAAAADALRDLRRSAVATVPLRTEQLTGIVLSASFLVEQELWKEFASKVKEQGSRAPNIRLELTGPWPPYDFVQMQFGG